MRDDLFIAAGEESVELGLQNHREKGVAEQVYAHPYSIIPPKCIFHVHLDPIEELELEEGEVLPPCKICASSQPVSTSIHGNPIIAAYAGLQIDPELIAAIATLVRSAQIDLVDPDLLTMFLSNPQLVEQEMKVLLASLATEKIPKPNMALSKPELIALPHAGMPNMAAGRHNAKKVIDEYGEHVGGNPLSGAECSSSMPISKKEHLKNIVKSDGAHQSVGDKPPCKFFNTSNGCWNDFKLNAASGMMLMLLMQREGRHNRLWRIWRAGRSVKEREEG
nr:zinc finger CCCH domain-containing protein 6-like isoform X2 [Ipomoea batatas]